MAFTEDTQWIQKLMDSESRLLWENPDYAARVAPYLRAVLALLL